MESVDLYKVTIRYVRRRKSMEEPVEDSFTELCCTYGCENPLLSINEYVYFKYPIRSILEMRIEAYGYKGGPVRNDLEFVMLAKDCTAYNDLRRLYGPGWFSSRYTYFKLFGSDVPPQGYAREYL